MTEFANELGVLEPWVRQYGATSVFVTLTFESFGLPLPGESLLIVAAILAGRGDMSFPGLFAAAWGGAVIGDNIGYLIGRMIGRDLLRRYGEKIGLNDQRLGKVEAAFARYGSVTVGVARFFNVLRQLNGIVAGALKIEWWRFLIFNALGGAAWVAVWATAGRYLGLHGADAAMFVPRLGYWGALLTAVAAFTALAVFYWRRGHARS